MTTLQQAIEQLYTVFGKYTTEGMHHCPCGCIDAADVRRLASKPLRELAIEDMAAYHGSAIYTWGDLEQYKHYLPRFLELQSQHRSFALIDLSDIYSKLEAAQWTEWPAEELTAIRDYLVADWEDLVNGPAPELAGERIGYYSCFLELADLLRCWDVLRSGSALRSFVYFFYYHGNGLLAGGLRLGEKKYGGAFGILFRNGALKQRLEEEFFRTEGSDAAYAGKVSVVLQMLEQEERARGAQGL